MPHTDTEIDSSVLETAMIPRRFWNLDADDYFGDEFALKLVDRYCKKHRKVYANGTNLLFTGGRDSGKTFLLTYVLRCLMLEKYKVLYMTLAELTELMMNPDNKGERFMSAIIRPDFLAIDSVNDINEGHKNALSRAINRRRDEAKPTFIATAFDDKGDDEPFLETRLGADDWCRFKDIAVEVKCKVNPFKVRKHRKQILGL